MSPPSPPPGPPHAPPQGTAPAPRGAQASGTTAARPRPETTSSPERVAPGRSPWRHSPAAAAHRESPARRRRVLPWRRSCTPDRDENEGTSGSTRHSTATSPRAMEGATAACTTGTGYAERQHIAVEDTPTRFDRPIHGDRLDRPGATLGLREAPCRPWTSTGGLHGSESNSKQGPMSATLGSALTVGTAKEPEPQDPALRGSASQVLLRAPCWGFTDRREGYRPACSTATASSSTAGEARPSRPL